MILITADRFTENDTWLGNEFRQQNKKFFFVRTKIGIDISNDRMAHPTMTRNEDAVVAKILQSTADHLEGNGCDDVPLFLIDSYEPRKFDFEQLKRQIIMDFPEIKRSALVLSLQATSKQLVDLKVTELRSRIWKSAAVAGGVAALPVPFASLVFDFAVVKREAEFYFTQLGLDDTSLERYARQNSVDSQRLKSVVYERLWFYVSGAEGIKQMVELHKCSAPVPASATSALIEAGAAEECSKYLPVVGSLIAASLCFAGTYYTLKVILAKMEDVALEIMNIATEDAASAGKSGNAA